MSLRAGYGVIWDVDGVIIDSAAQHLEAWRAMAAENGFPFDDALFWETFGMRNADIMPRMFGISGPERRIAELASRKEELYRERLRREATALPGARELLAALHEAGYRQALGSSAPSANIETIVSLLGIAPYLEAIVSGENVPRGKPAPDIFVTAAERLGIAPARCLVIEDAPAGVAAAHAGGMRCLAVRRVGQEDAPGLERADYLATSLADVDVALIDGLLGVRG